MNKRINLFLLLLFIVLSTLTVESFGQATLYFRYSDSSIVVGNPMKFQYNVQIKASTSGTMLSQFYVRSSFSTTAFVGTASSIYLTLNPAFNANGNSWTGFSSTPSVAGTSPKYFNSSGASSGPGILISNTDWVTLLTVTMDILNPCEVAGFGFNNANWMSTRNKYKTSNNYIIDVTYSSWANQGLGYTAPATTTWNGSVSSNWASNSNWNNGVPCSTSNVIIGSGTNALILDQDVSCNNLSILSGGKLTLNATRSIATSGTFTINDGGSYINLGSNNNTATVERTISNGDWHLLSSPVLNQSIFGQFAASLPESPTNTFDFYKWDETVATTGNVWLNLRDGSGNLNTSDFPSTQFDAARGYLVAYNGWSTTHAFSGTLNNGNQTIAISNNNNHTNLFGNPYPSAIDWNASGYTRSSLLDNTIYIWNPTDGEYGVYNGVGTHGVTNIIAPNQGFFVVAASSGTLIIPNTARVHGSQSFMKSTTADLLRLKVSSSINSYNDEIIVNFNSNATANEGAAKWFSMVSGAPSLYTVKNNANLSINTLPSISANLTVPVGFKAGVNGLYSISASELNSFSAPTYIYLNDLNSNTITDLNQHPSYAFTASTTDNANRFQLIFATTALAISNNVIEHTGIYSYDNTITINSNENMKEIAIYNTMGQLIKTIGNSNGTINVNMNGNPIGYYVVKVITDKNVYSQKVLVK